MTVAHGLIAVVVYVVIAFLSSSSVSRRAKRDGELTVFPISKMVRLLVWSGGLFCAVAAVQDMATGGLRFTGIFLIVVSVATVLVPLQSVAISSSAGYDSLIDTYRSMASRPPSPDQSVATQN